MILNDAIRSGWRKTVMGWKRVKDDWEGEEREGREKIIIA